MQALGNRFCQVGDVRYRDQLDLLVGHADYKTPFQACGEQDEGMQHHGSGVRVIDVENLGREALLVTCHPPFLLLLDAGLTPEERIECMGRAMDRCA